MYSTRHQYSKSMEPGTIARVTKVRTRIKLDLWLYIRHCRKLYTKTKLKFPDLLDSTAISEDLVSLSV